MSSVKESDKSDFYEQVEMNEQETLREEGRREVMYQLTYLITRWQKDGRPAEEILRGVLLRCLYKDSSLVRKVSK